MTSFRSTTALLATVLLVSLSGTDAHAVSRVRLQLRWQHQFQFAGYYLAVDRGYYRQAGLDVELVEAVGELRPLSEVTSGRAEYGVGSSDLVLARSRGEPVVALAAIYQHSPLVLLSVRENGIESVHDLKGKRVALEHEAADLVGYLKREGIGLSEVETLPHAMDVADLLAGRVDAMSAYQTDEPFLLNEAGRDVRMFAPRAGGIDFYGDTLFTTEREVRAHPERVDAVIQATLRGWRDALREPGVAIDAVLARSKRHSRAHLEFEARTSAPLIAADLVELGYMNPGRWEHIASTYAELGLTPRTGDLKGFLYRADPPARLPAWVLPVLASAFLASLGILFGWLWALRLSRVLARAEQRWRAFVEASPMPVLIVGAGGRVLYQNPRAQALDAEPDEHRLQGLFRREEVREALDKVRSSESATAQLEAFLGPSRSRAMGGDGGHDVTEPPRWLSLSLAPCDVDGGRAVLVAIADITSQKNLLVSLRREVDSDALTGALSRRRVLAVLDELVAEKNLPFALGIVDVDHFKSVNDKHGHALGDRVLVELVRVCRDELRGHDVVGRLGGEEFLLLLPHTDEKAARAVGERLRASVESALARVDGLTLGVTISLGFAVATHARSLGTLQLQADRALYRAKASGRNRVCLADVGDVAELSQSSA